MHKIEDLKVKIFFIERENAFFDRRRLFTCRGHGECSLNVEKEKEDRGAGEKHLVVQHLHCIYMFLCNGF